MTRCEVDAVTEARTQLGRSRSCSATARPDVGSEHTIIVWCRQRRSDR